MSMPWQFYRPSAAGAGDVRQRVCRDARTARVFVLLHRLSQSALLYLGLFSSDGFLSI
jgi:hypothetical protein